MRHARNPSVFAPQSRKAGLIWCFNLRMGMEDCRSRFAGSDFGNELTPRLGGKGGKG